MKLREWRMSCFVNVLVFVHYCDLSLVIVLSLTTLLILMIPIASARLHGILYATLRTFDSPASSHGPRICSSAEPPQNMVADVTFLCSNYGNILSRWNHGRKSSPYSDLLSIAVTSYYTVLRCTHHLLGMGSLPPRTVKVL